MHSIFRGLWSDEEGAATVEYALLLCVIAIGCIGAWTGLRDRLITAIGAVENSISP